MTATRCDHAPNPSLRTHACGTAVHPSQAAYVAYDYSPLRSLRNYHRYRSIRATGRVARECRALKGGRLVLHAVADPASLAQSADECKVHEVQRRVALVVARASQRNWLSQSMTQTKASWTHTLWGRPCPATSSFPRKRKWHYQLYTGCMGLLHHTVIVRLQTRRSSQGTTHL